MWPWQACHGLVSLALEPNGIDERGLYCLPMLMRIWGRINRATTDQWAAEQVQH